MADEILGKYVIEREDLHDCFFIVGTKNQEKISAVKIFLANHSPYFREIFLHMGTNKDSKICIPIREHEPDVFNLMLSYFYGHPDLKFQGIDQAMRFYLLVGECLVPQLMKKSVNYLVKNCKTYDEILNCHILLKIKEMETRAKQLVQEDTENLLSVKEFIDFDPSIILFIVKQEQLNVSEMELWKGVMKWAKHQCGYSTNGSVIREKLSDVLGHIRFLTIPIEEFIKEIIPSSLLTQNEIQAILVAKITGEDCTVSSLCKEKRKRVLDTFNVIVDCNPSISIIKTSCCTYLIDVKTRLKLNSLDMFLNRNCKLVVLLKYFDNQLIHGNVYLSNQDGHIKLGTSYELEANQTYKLELSDGGYNKIIARNLGDIEIAESDHYTISVYVNSSNRYFSCLRNLELTVLH